MDGSEEVFLTLTARPEGSRSERWLHKCTPNSWECNGNEEAKAATGNAGKNK